MHICTFHARMHAHMRICVYLCMHVRYLKVLLAAKKRGHHLLCFIPMTTFQTQPDDRWGFGQAKGEVANIKASRNLIGDQDRYTTANIWVTALLAKWYV